MRIFAFFSFFFFFNDTATTEIYTLSLHDALPICAYRGRRRSGARPDDATARRHDARDGGSTRRDGFPAGRRRSNVDGWQVLVGRSELARRSHRDASVSAEIQRWSTLVGWAELASSPPRRPAPAAAAGVAANLLSLG